MDKIKLLIVDDEVVIQRSCIDIFEEKSDCYEIKTVSSGDDALVAMEMDRFDIILTDLKMPGLPGIELLSRIRDRFPETAVVVITGFSTVQTAVEVMKLGAVDFIPKPFTPDEVFSAVDNIARRLKG